MSFRKIKFYQLYCSLFKAGYDTEYAAMIAYFVKNKKKISERYMSRVFMMPIISTNILIFTDEELKYFDDVLIKLKTT